MNALHVGTKHNELDSIEAGSVKIPLTKTVLRSEGFKKGTEVEISVPRIIKYLR